MLFGPSIDEGSVRNSRLGLQGPTSEVTSELLQLWGSEKEDKGLGFSTKNDHRDRRGVSQHIASHGCRIVDRSELVVASDRLFRQCQVMIDA
jgi:hypothetical protein